ncbi:cyanocobalamin reductase / alkylcobalamin dealkylase [Chanos chanos]|uniref:Cyanocobalamin reductase / alkylcobalamin dealkylase n=1 Tax=Chanos chanos TaxID=29144 RepID=A0A6J2V9X4_CHACN|nr:methylmalonic aciduria and homocystinuria type C protein [Chanos chanos]
MAIPCHTMEDIVGTLRSSLGSLGFEVYPFKVAWYNAVTSSAFHLRHPEDTLAVVILSTPSMFERLFLPFLRSRRCDLVKDPIDQCVTHTITTFISQHFPDQSVEISFDYEILPNRRPKFLAQTAAHVAGAAYYYKASDIPNPPWGDKKMFGVCVHPRLGGWFAIRALLVFRDLEAGPGLQQTPPPNCVTSREDRIDLLERFNFHWQDWNYRDIITAEERYSPQQKEYFLTPPAQREALLQKWGFLTEVQNGRETEDTIGDDSH